MRVGLTGASGQLGMRVLSHLLDRIPRSEIVAITRSPDRLDRISMQGVRVVRGDFNDAVSLRQAFDGIERLLLIPGSDHRPGIRTRQHQTAIDSAVAAGVKHIVYVSMIGARPGTILETHFITEQALIASKAAWTVLRMSVFAETLSEPVRRAADCGSYFALPSAPVAYIVRDDLAAAAAGLLATPGHDGATYLATGPVSVTPAQIAESISRIARKPVVFSALTIDEYLSSLESAGLSTRLANVVLRLQQELQAGVFDVVTGDVERLAGRPAVTFEDLFARLSQE